ncbi:MAG: Ig-like domain-containing protein [Lachnospiraceae bacterium]|nr:Ig-like domain-containing protein [Lachnospiraceae bacterium]
MKKTGIAILLAALLFGQTAAAAVYEGQVQETEIQTEAYEEVQAPAEDRETELILPGDTDEEQEIGEEGSRETETTESETDPASAAEPADDFILSIEVSNPETEQNEQNTEVIEAGPEEISESGDVDQASAGSSSSRMRRARSRVAYQDGYGEQLSDDMAVLYRNMKTAWVDAGSMQEVWFRVTDTQEEKEAHSFWIYPEQKEDGTWSNHLAENEEYQRLTRAVVQQAYDAFIYDYPEAFWLGSCSYTVSYQPSSNAYKNGEPVVCYLRSIKVKPNERYAGAGDPAEIAAFQQAVEQTAAEIKETFSDQPDRYEQVLAIHDYLCTHVSYKENSYAHTAAGVFLKNREVVCEGYAKAFKILCGRFGIPAVLIPGGALKSNGTREGHMWNYVQMEDGFWYMLDTTWDDQKTYISRKYFLSGGEEKGFTGNTIAVERQELYTNFSKSEYSVNFALPVLSDQGYSARHSSANPHAHSWQEWQRTAGTCIEEGRIVFGCTVSGCTARKTEVLEKSDHVYGAYQPDGNATCLADGTKTRVCSVCKAQETVADPGSATGHKYGAYQPDGNATCLADGTKTRVCSVCKARETVRDPGSRLVPTGSLSQKKIRLQYRQSTSAVKVSGLAKGDFVQTWKSSRPSVASVSSKGKITAKKKSGSAKISAYLASGKVLTVTVTVQKKAVKTTALRDVPKRLTLRRGRTVKLQPTRIPVTSREKITYKSANTRIAKVSKKGVITGKKAGTVKITVRSGRKKAVVTVKVK